MYKYVIMTELQRLEQELEQNLKIYFEGDIFKVLRHYIELKSNNDIGGTSSKSITIEGNGTNEYQIEPNSKLLLVSLDGIISNFHSDNNRTLTYIKDTGTLLFLGNIQSGRNIFILYN